MRIRGLGAVRRAGLWARSAIRPGPIILGYHRIAESKWDPQYLCVSPDNFAVQLKALLDRAKPLSLTGLRRSMEQGTHLHKAFVITLDDGYADSLDVAAPILEEYGVPATVFVSTGMIGKPFWWCEVQYLVENAPELPAEISFEAAGRRFRWSRKDISAGARARLLQSFRKLFRRLPFESQEDALAKIRDSFKRKGDDESDVRGMTAEEIAILANMGNIEVGSHLVTHTSLNQLSEDAQRAELRESKERLEEIIGRQVQSFSYPNGRLSRASPRLAREVGYSVGCTSREALTGQGCDPMRLPRAWAGNWDVEHFSRWLRRWRL